VSAESSARIRVASGRHVVDVRVYETLADLRAAGRRFNGAEGLDDTVGLCQVSYHVRPDGTATVRPIVRLCRWRLSSQIVSHEMHHAVTAIYGSTLADDALASDVLTHHNETFAHLYSDMLSRLVDRLYDRGYYGHEAAA